jgi:hypothetical protein
MRNYSQNTQELVADVINGIKVETSALANLTYWDNSDHVIFNVFGRIKLTCLFAEVVTVADAHATTMQFKYEQVSPFAIAAAALTAVMGAGDLTSAAQGTRVVCLGGAVATAALLDAGPGITGYTYPMIIGTGNTAAGVQAVGTIIVDTAGAANHSGTTKYVIHYVPLSDGAYVTAVG